MDAADKLQLIVVGFVLIVLFGGFLGIGYWKTYTPSGKEYFRHVEAEWKCKEDTATNYCKSLNQTFDNITYSDGKNDFYCIIDDPHLYYTQSPRYKLTDNEVKHCEQEI